jgi:hypothetical protein
LLPLQIWGRIPSFEDFARLADVDDIYTLTAQITDLAGNTSQQSVVFSVNRFGSVYELIEGTDERIAPYYLNQAPLLVVRETNVNDLSNRSILLARDGDVSTLEEDEAYTVAGTTGVGGWKIYTYTVSVANFEKDGTYSVTLISEDRATNTSSNRIQTVKRSEFPVEFVVDKTPPAILVMGIKQDGRYTEAARPMLLNVEDNLALNYFIVEVSYTNGSSASGTYTLQNLNNGNVMEYGLTAWKNWQCITLRAVDMSGNVAEVQSYDILLSENIFVQFTNNTLAVVMAAVVLLGTAFLFFRLLVKRRKKVTEE